MCNLLHDFKRYCLIMSCLYILILPVKYFIYIVTLEPVECNPCKASKDLFPYYGYKQAFSGKLL